NGGGANLTTSSVSVTAPAGTTIISGSAQSPTLTTSTTNIPFSIDSKLTVSNLTVGNEANLTWTSTATGTATAVPVPAGLVLVISAFPVLGAGAWLRKRKKSA